MFFIIPVIYRHNYYFTLDNISCSYDVCWNMKKQRGFILKRIEKNWKNNI